MEKFIEYVLQFGNLNKQQIELITNKAKEIELRKGEYFAEIGKPLKQVGFIIEGIMRIYGCEQNCEEITHYFIDANHLIADVENPKSNFCLETLTDCKLIVFSRKDWKEISDTIMDWDNIVQKVIAKHYVEKLARRNSLVAQDATTRYLEFMKNFPALTNRIPLKYLASYLGITDTSLSCIRKSIR